MDRVAVTTASAIVPKLLSLAILLVRCTFRRRHAAARWVRRVAALDHRGGPARLCRPRVGQWAAQRSRGCKWPGRSGRDATGDLERVRRVGARGRRPGGSVPPDDPDRQLVEVLGVHGASAGSVTAAIGVFVTGIALAVAFGAAPRVRLALQTGWVNNAWGAAGGVISLAAVVIAAACDASLPVLVGAAVVGPPLVAAADTMLLFAFQRPDLRPRWASIHRVDATRLGRKGAMFCFLAVAIAVGYESDALVISHALGAGAVAQFALPYRILMLAPAAVSLVTVALWPAYSEAVAHGDQAWADRTLKRSLILAVGGTALVSLLVVAIGPYAWAWLTGTADVPTRGLLLVLGLLACVMSASTALGVFLERDGTVADSGRRRGGDGRDQLSLVDRAGGPIGRFWPGLGNDHHADPLRPRSRRTGGRRRRVATLRRHVDTAGDRGSGQRTIGNRWSGLGGHERVKASRCGRRRRRQASCLMPGREPSIRPIAP